ncbi:MAG: BamA/TamA family outer membrane protein [Balneolales bacterium]
MTPPDTSAYSILPSFGYNSDLGFSGGATVNRYLYDAGHSPYKSFMDLAVVASTKGFASSQLSYNRTNIFGTHARTNLELHVNRRLNDNYFGIGNSSPFDNDLWDDDYYNFESVSLGASVRTRHPLYLTDERRLDFLSLAGLSYNIPYDDDGQRLIGQDQPEGFTGGWLNYIGAGLMWDTRDDEFDPGSGNQLRAEFYLMPGLLLSDYNMSVLYGEARQFINLKFLNNTVIALRGGIEHAVGDIPYWQLPFIGGEATIRGYPYARYRGKSALFYNVELRNWLVADEFYDLRLGFHIFSDAGRVFNGQGEWDQLFSDHKRTYGLGLAFGPYDSDIIFRMDYALSSEMRRLYIGLGYLF